MASRSFIDTNVLIYAEARDAPAKQRAALDLLRHLFEDATGVLSTQVLHEYCNVAVKNSSYPSTMFGRNWMCLSSMRSK